MGRLYCASFFLCCALLCGCGVDPQVHTSGASSAVGRVMGGNQPVGNSKIQLYAVSTLGDGTAATPLLSPAVTSDAGGNFSLPAWTCTPGTYVYLTATGGNPGLSNGTNNAALALMTAWGPCDTLTPSSFVQINEVTTVAAVYALAVYMKSASQVGSFASDAADLHAAFALANMYANPATGRSPGTNVSDGYSVPTAKINTLANILSTCENSDGTTTACTSLFADAESYSDGYAPNNTVNALLNIALGSAMNFDALFGLATSNEPFQPSLATDPREWSLSLSPNTLSGEITLSQDAVIYGMAYRQLPTQVDVTLTNTGTGPLTLGPIGLANNLALVGWSTTCASVVAPSASCIISIFPYQGGDRCRYSLCTNPGYSTLYVTNSGSAISSRIDIFAVTGLGFFNPGDSTYSGSPVDFGTVPVGTTGSSTQSFAAAQYGFDYRFQAIYVYNFGGDYGDFLVTGGSCFDTTCPPATIQFHPLMKGKRYALVEIQAGDGSSTLTSGYFLLQGIGN